MPLLLFTVPVVSTLLGGALALRFRRHVMLLIAVGAGLLLGVAFLDLLPEALNLGGRAALSSSDVLAWTLLCFLGFHAVEAVSDAIGQRWGMVPRGAFFARRSGAVMLILHSFRDGMAIGAAYAAMHSAGYAVALGIAAHDLGDGMNTVILTTGGERARWGDYLFLLADALAPFLGGVFTAWWVLSERGSVLLLVMAAAFFLQMATGDFLPQILRNEGRRRYLLAYVCGGALLVYAANLLIARHR